MVYFTKIPGNKININIAIKNVKTKGTQVRVQDQASPGAEMWRIHGQSAGILPEQIRIHNMNPHPN